MAAPIPRRLQSEPSGSWAQATVWAIPELIGAIAREVDHPATLLTLSCACRRFTDIALSCLWEEPMFNGSPLIEMLPLFPEEMRELLLASHDPELRVPTEAFERFDYYAKFIKSIHLWHHGREGYLAHVLAVSRPGTWFFPSVIDLHLGATGEELETVPAYLTPSLQSLYLNHWDGQGGREITPNEALKQTLLQVFELAYLDVLDMADTLYTPMEDDQEIVLAFAKLAAQLVDCQSQSFLTLPAVFERLSNNDRLRSIFLNTTSEGPAYVALPEIAQALQDRFPALRTLGLYCTIDHAVSVFDNLRRPIPYISLKISTPLEAGALHAVISSIFSSADSALRSLRITSARNMFCDKDPPVRLSEVLHPLIASHELRKLEIMIGFSGEQMMRDEEIAEFFRAWPKLRVCSIVNDAEGDLPALEGEETSFGLSLKALLAAARHSGELRALTLPFVDTEVIPTETDDIPRIDHKLTLQLSSSHVHNLADVQAFVRKLWREGEIFYSGCDHQPATNVGF